MAQSGLIVAGVDLFAAVSGVAGLKFLGFGPAGALFRLPPSRIDGCALCLRIFVGDLGKPSLSVETISVVTALNVFWRELVLRGMLRHDLVAYGAGIDVFLPKKLRSSRFLQRRAVVVKELEFSPRPTIISCGQKWAPDPTETRSPTVEEYCWVVFEQMRLYAEDHGYFLRRASFSFGTDSLGRLTFGGQLGVPGRDCHFCDKKVAPKYYFGSRPLPMALPRRGFFRRLTGQTLRSFQREEMEIV